MTSQEASLTSVAVATTSVAEYRAALRCLRRRLSPVSAPQAPPGRSRVGRRAVDDVSSASWERTPASRAENGRPLCLAVAARSIFASCIFCASLRSIGELRRRRTTETATCAATSHVERHHGQILQIAFAKRHRRQTYSCRLAGTI